MNTKKSILTDKIMKDKKEKIELQEEITIDIQVIKKIDS
jgi:hypothetical protein